MKNLLSKAMRLSPVMACLIALSAGSAMAEDYKIGGIGSLTGPASPFARDVHDGLQAYIKAWNERGGYNGRTVVLDVVDDETNSVVGVTNFRRVATDPSVQAMFTFGPSQTAVAIKQIADEFKVPVIGTGTVDQLAVPPAKYFFRALPGTEANMQELMDWAVRKGFKTIAILNPTDAVGQREAALIKEMVDKAGLKLVAAESYNTTDTNFTAQLVNIRDAKPDFLYAGSVGAPAVLVYKQIKQLQLSMPLAMHSAAFSRNFFESVGGPEAVEGVFTPIERGALADEAVGAAAEQYAALNKALGKKGNQFQTTAWDMGLLLEYAVTHSDGTRDGIRKALEEAKDVPVIGGYFTFTEANHGGKDQRGVVMAEYKGGHFVTAK